MIELQEANKDVLLGKRNVNCLSCGVTDASIANVTMGKDGRVYRASLNKGFQEMTLDLGSSDYKNRSGPARISSANPNKRNSQKFPDSSNNPAYNESALFKDNNRANSLSNNQYTSN